LPIAVAATVKRDNWRAYHSPEACHQVPRAAHSPTMAGSKQSSTGLLRRLYDVKQQSTPMAVPLGPEMLGFFKQSVAKRQTKLVRIAESWGQLVPETLNDHCSLESLNRGSLIVLVDSASHLYELKQLLLAGLERQLQLACKSAGLRKVMLRPGRWYAGDSGDRSPRFGC